MVTFCRWALRSAVLVGRNRIEKYDGDAEPAGQAPAKRLFRRNQLDLPWVLLLAFRRQSEMLRDNITTCRHLLSMLSALIPTINKYSRSQNSNFRLISEWTRAKKGRRVSTQWPKQTTKPRLLKNTIECLELWTNDAWITNKKNLPPPYTKIKIGSLEN